MFRMKCGCGAHASYRRRHPLPRRSAHPIPEKTRICEECHAALPEEGRRAYVRPEGIRR